MKKAADKNVIPFIVKSRGAKKAAKDGDVIDHGDIGGLKFEVYSRNDRFRVIHIFNTKRTSLFKKDAEDFKDAIDAIEFEDMADGDEHLISGSGANDDLLFTCENGEIKISIRRQGLGVIDKLKSIISGGGKKKKKEAIQ